MGERPADDHTATLGPARAGPDPTAVRRFRIVHAEGPKAGEVWESAGERCSIGSHPLNDLVIDDPTVSRFHCEVRITPRGMLVADQDSRNGTFVDGVLVREAFLRGGSSLRLGRSVLRLELGLERNKLLLSEAGRFGTLVGSSVPMRHAFALLERAAAADVTVLLEGETGTGKGAAAESIHAASARADGPFLVIDCGAIPANLLESELFGHEKGAFTGAEATRLGAFEEADGGTIFLDEIGELPLDLQPKLLRVLESRKIRRVGANEERRVDVRVVAATNRDLRAEVNEGRFRPDLYYRLAVVKIRLPPLRERPEDVRELAETVLTSLRATPEQLEALRDGGALASIEAARWPGNVRQLRNYLERWLVFRDLVPEELEAAGAAPAAEPADRSEPARADLPYAEARRRAITEFERRYVEALLSRHGGKVAQAAEAAGMDRVYLYRLLRKHRQKDR
jgi:two-component system, NtrC family, response regulator GlrR